MFESSARRAILNIAHKIDVTPSAAFRAPSAPAAILALIHTVIGDAARRFRLPGTGRHTASAPGHQVPVLAEAAFPGRPKNILSDTRIRFTVAFEHVCIFRYEYIAVAVLFLIFRMAPPIAGTWIVIGFPAKSVVFIFSASAVNLYFRKRCHPSEVPTYAYRLNMSAGEARPGYSDRRR